MTPTPNVKHQPSTHFQPYEKLLIGWIVGAAWLEHQAHRDDEDETAAQHLPPSTASSCLQDGTGANRPVTISTTMLSKKGEEREGRTMMTPAPMPMPTAPALAPAPPTLMVSVRSPRGKIHNLRLNSRGVSSKGLGFSLCGGLLMHGCLENLLASHS